MHLRRNECICTTRSDIRVKTLGTYDRLIQKLCQHPPDGISQIELCIIPCDILSIFLKNVI